MDLEVLATAWQQWPTQHCGPQHNAVHTTSRPALEKRVHSQKLNMRKRQPPASTGGPANGFGLYMLFLYYRLILE